jgi:predicted nucleotidyltransferase
MPSFKAEYDNLPTTIQNVVTKIIAITNPRTLILFGSRARRDNRENSDFDFAITARSCSEKDWNQLILTIADEPITLFKVELVELERLNKEYQGNISKDGVLIYG